MFIPFYLFFFFKFAQYLGNSGLLIVVILDVSVEDPKCLSICGLFSFLLVS